MRRPRLLLAQVHFLASLGFLLSPALGGAQEVLRVPFQAVPDFVGWVEDEFIVVLGSGARATVRVERRADGLPGVDVPSLQRLLEAHRVQRFELQFPSARPQSPGSPRPDLTGHYKVKLGPGASLDAAIAAFASDPSVEHVERIGMHTMYATPNDPFYQDSPNPSFDFDQWHYWDTHGIHVDQAWDTQTGDASVVVGIIDTGVRYFHVDLGGNSPVWGPGNPFAGGNIFVNPGETPGNSLDDDGNGFVDDTVGWDFVSAAGGGGTTCLDVDCSGVDNDADDGVGHGTHLAGTVGAITNNNSTVAGVAGGFSDGSATDTGNGVKILPLRIGFLARLPGGTVTGVVRMDWAAEAMNYVADLVDAGVNVVAVNCSWASSNSGGLGAAVDNVLAHDVMVVHAAGNSNSSTADFFGSRTDVVNVAATDINGNGASFTNHGTWVDVAAPGVTILSTYRNPNDTNPTNHYIAIADGTSMAAPHVTGIAALLESCTPALTGPQKFALIVNNTDPYTDVRNLGSGIANAKEALDAANCGACDLTAIFSSTPPAGCAPLSVAFTDLSTGTGIDTWSWAFGDGGTSSAQNPTHDYLNAGIYTVTLVVSNGSCSDTLVVPDVVGVLTPPPVAAFSGTPTTGEVPLQVGFTDASTNAPTSWSWDFGDGNGSAEQDPSHTYQTPGTYSVTLIATNACGPDTLLQVDYVVANPSTTSVPAGLVGRGTGSWVSPNPFGPATQIFFRLERQAPIEIVVYDVGGRPVRHLVSRAFAPGTYAIPFDGRDDRGARLASGLYVYRFAAGARVEARKLVVWR